jgi:hypothetical protein
MGYNKTMITQSHNNIYKNILSEQDIKDIYDVVNKAKDDSSVIVKHYRQKAYFVDLPEHVVDKIVNFVKNIYPYKITLKEISFATYKKIDGADPILSPHFDTTFEEHRFTFDIQVKSNISWPLVVEGKEFLLNDNEALTFFGTSQIHWRTYREFKEDEFIDMIFCHFVVEENSKKITIEETRETNKRLLYFMDNFYQEIIKGLKK